MRELERDGVTIAYDVVGPIDSTAPPVTVVLLHNIFCDRRVFEGAVAALRQGHRTIALDFRGHGESGAGEAPYAIADLVADVLAVLDRERVTRAVVVGLSIGATVAMELALAHPERVAGLVLMGADAEGDSLVTAARNRLFGAAVTLLGMRGFVLSGVTKTLFGRWFRTQATQRFAVFRERIARFEPRAARRSMRAWAGRRPLLDPIRALEVPTRVVVGDEDVSCPLPCGQKIQQAIAGADLVRIPQAGHTMTAERPAETTAAILSFISRAGPR